MVYRANNHRKATVRFVHGLIFKKADPTDCNLWLDANKWPLCAAV